jgi:hypothetical protein
MRTNLFGFYVFLVTLGLGLCGCAAGRQVAVSVEYKGIKMDVGYAAD